MVNPVGTTGGYQPYSYQQQIGPQQEPRGGDNRVERREAPAPDTQRGDQRSLASRDEDTRRNDNNDSTSSRGQSLDITV